MLDIPASLQRVFLSLLAVGFPVAVVLAWALEWTPAGLRRDRGEQVAVPKSSRGFDRAIIAVLAIAVGYFLVAEFAFTPDEPVRAAPASVAVLPFANMSGDAANDPFTAGIHDDILTHLSRIAALRTTSRTTVMRYERSDKTVPEIAAELGVDTIVEGGVQAAGGRVRVNVQLIDGSNDAHLWADTFDRELTAANVFDIQSDIATAIAAALRANLTADDQRRLAAVPTQNIDALQTYFIGKRMLELVHAQE